MPDTTTTTNTATATTCVDTSTNINHDLPSPTQVPSRTPACAACQVSFDDVSEQRGHMKHPWHVENVRRKAASLPPIRKPSRSPPRISVELVSREDKTEDENPEGHSNREGSRSGSVKEALPFHCLFCNESFEPVGLYGDEEDEDVSACLDKTIEHMRNVHGFIIPNQDAITDMEIFLEYLSTVVRHWHECLYCGATGHSTRGIQNHMKDKRHCKLNPEREPELLEFWEHEDTEEEEETEPSKDGIETANQVSENEIRLPSGKILSSRRGPTPRKPRNNIDSTALIRTKDGSPSRSPNSEQPQPKLPEAKPPKDKRMIRRGDMMGIIGLHDQQHRALLYAEKAAQHSEAAARKRHQWAYDKRANSQKHDQLQTGPMAKAKAGLHQLLPR